MYATLIYVLVFLVTVAYVGYGAWLGRDWIKRYRDTYVEKATVDLEDLFWVASGVEVFYIGIVLAAVLAALTWAIMGSLIGAGVAATMGMFIPLWYLRHMKAKRLAKFEAQLVDALALLASSLRAGLNLSQAVDRVAEGSLPPLSSEFRVMTHERKVGRSEEDAFENLAKRVPSEDVGLMVTAILTNRRTGGNIAELFDTIASTIRERIVIKQKVSALTAQAKGEAIVIAVLPPALLGIFMLIDPEMAMPLFKTFAGNCVLVFVTVWEIIGFLCMRYLLRVEY